MDFRTSFRGAQGNPAALMAAQHVRELQTLGDAEQPQPGDQANPAMSYAASMRPNDAIRQNAESDFTDPTGALAFALQSMSKRQNVNPQSPLPQRLSSALSGIQ